MSFRAGTDLHCSLMKGTNLHSSPPGSSFWAVYQNLPEVCFKHYKWDPSQRPQFNWVGCCQTRQDLNISLCAVIHTRAKNLCPSHSFWTFFFLIHTKLCIIWLGIIHVRYSNRNLWRGKKVAIGGKKQPTQTQAYPKNLHSQGFKREFLALSGKERMSLPQNMCCILLHA